jgi:energy-coupling factor transporter ATP-binding protein EcfA2
MIKAGEHVTIFGITGCGKSTLTARVAEIFARRIIFDRLYQWPVSPADTVHNFSEFCARYKEVYQQASFTILVQPAPGMSQDDLLMFVDAVLSVVYQVERVNRHGLALIFEEIWLYAPVHSMPRWFQEMILTGRNWNISIIGNAQRPAMVSKSIVSQSRHVFVGQFFEARDRKYFEECFGQTPELDNPPEKYHFYWYRPGVPPLLITTDQQ